MCHHNMFLLKKINSIWLIQLVVFKKLLWRIAKFTLKCFIKPGICVETIIQSSFYVPTDFDTIEKAFSGDKTAEKGIK